MSRRRYQNRPRRYNPNRCSMDGGGHPALWVLEIPGRLILWAARAAWRKIRRR